MLIIIEYNDNRCEVYTVSKRPTQTESRDERRRRAIAEAAILNAKANVNKRKRSGQKKRDFWKRYREGMEADTGRTDHIPSAPMAGTSGAGSGASGTAARSVFDSRWRNTYDDNPVMAEREAEALAKAEALKARIAPAYNKGAYQLTTSQEDLKTTHNHKTGYWRDPVKEKKND